MTRCLPYVIGVLCLAASPAKAQSPSAPVMPAGIWTSDQGDGTYINPVLTGDYSDPDAVRVGDDYYLVSSSFTNVPGLPILHSKDLVNWTIVGHAIDRNVPEAHYAVPRRGGAAMAPAIRYHNGRFYVYYPDPDYGIFMVSAADPKGPWTAPVLVDTSKGAIDPCPFWDDDGSAWLVNAGAGSRHGKTDTVTLHRLSADGTHTIGDPIYIIDGHKLPPVQTSHGEVKWTTIEGPKLYKRNSWYYVFVPAGGVKEGWQGVFRSRTIEGPYEGRDVMDQGTTWINGAHQGAWVDTPSGENWFLHFSDADAYGRRVFLEPMTWTADGWPVIGKAQPGATYGEPVTRFKKPDLPGQPITAPVADDDFADGFNLAWQWSANPAADWVDTGVKGRLRLNAASSPADLWEAGNLLTQKLPGMAFSATTRIALSPKAVGERAGLLVLGYDYAWIGLENTPDGVKLVQMTRLNADSGEHVHKLVDSHDEVTAAAVRITGPVYVRASFVPVDSPYPTKDNAWPFLVHALRARVTFSYSLDGVAFTSLGDGFTAIQGKWVGAQVGLFAQAPSGTPAYTATSTGFADFAFFHITP